MIWALRARARPGSLVLILVPLLGIGLLSSTALPLPHLGFAATRVPLGEFLPCLTVAGLVSALAGGSPERELASSRRWFVLERLFVVCGCTAACAVVVLLSRLSSSPVTWEAVRNVYGFCGVALVGRALLGVTAATAVPLVYAIATAVFVTPYSSAWWGWAYLPSATEPNGWALAIFVLGLGVGCGRRVTRAAALGVVDSA